jgi:hypothetical protein
MSKHGDRSDINNVIAFDTAIEFTWTRDAVVDLPDGSWEVRPMRPGGRGWVVADSHRERHTKWRRLEQFGSGK